MIGTCRTHLDEALPPAMGHYANAHTRAWADKRC